MEDLVIIEYNKYELNELRKIDLKLRKKLKLDTEIFFKMFKEKKRGDFFDRYHTDSKFREKHKKYMLEKTNCKKCGQMVARNYMTTHQRTKKCLNKNMEIRKIENNSKKEKIEKELLKNQNKLLQNQNELFKKIIKMK